MAGGANDAPPPLIGAAAALAGAAPTTMPKNDTVATMPTPPAKRNRLAKARRRWTRRFCTFITAAPLVMMSMFGAPDVGASDARLPLSPLGRRREPPRTGRGPGPP